MTLDPDDDGEEFAFARPGLDNPAIAILRFTPPAPRAAALDSPRGTSEMSYEYGGTAAFPLTDGRQGQLPCRLPGGSRRICPWIRERRVVISWAGSRPTCRWASASVSPLPAPWRTIPDCGDVADERQWPPSTGAMPKSCSPFSSNSSGRPGAGNHRQPRSVKGQLRPSRRRTGDHPRSSARAGRRCARCRFRTQAS